MDYRVDEACSGTAAAYTDENVKRRSSWGGSDASTPQRHLRKASPWSCRFTTAPILPDLITAGTRPPVGCTHFEWCWSTTAVPTSPGVITEQRRVSVGARHQPDAQLRPTEHHAVRRGRHATIPSSRWTTTLESTRPDSHLLDKLRRVRCRLQSPCSKHGLFRDSASSITRWR